MFGEGGGNFCEIWKKEIGVPPTPHHPWKIIVKFEEKNFRVPPNPHSPGKYCEIWRRKSSGTPHPEKLLEKLEKFWEKKVWKIFGTPQPDMALELTPDLELEGNPPPTPPEVAPELTPDLEPEGTPPPKNSRIAELQKSELRYPPPPVNRQKK